jgi:hypothetical protein
MRYQVIALLLSIAGFELVWAGDAVTNPNIASAEVAPLLAEMAAAANAHDVERHVGFYAHDDSVVFIFNGNPTVGWEAIRDKQREGLENRHIRRRLHHAGEANFPCPSIQPGGQHHFFEITSHNAKWTGN